MTLNYKYLLILIGSIFLIACSSKKNKYLVKVYQTSQTGGNLKLISNEMANTSFIDEDKKIRLKIKTDLIFQEYIGFGASFTESSAWNLAAIPSAKRKEVLVKLFSPTEGAGFSLTRTHINSSDYSNDHYTYVDSGDTDLSTFSVYEDLRGFSSNENSQVANIVLEDSTYDLIPMIREASSIKEADFKIIASPWSPPSWMKFGETSKMTNGSLLPKFYGLWAKYLSMYVSAYAKEGIKIWGMTPQNEPLHAHDARWDSNGLTAEQGRDFIKNHLGPQLVADGHLNLQDLNTGLRLLIYDHNKSVMNSYVSPTYQDPDANKYVWGTAFHWYANSQLKENDWFVHALDTLRNRWPDKGMIHTESSIDIDSNDPIGQYWRESTDYAGKFVPFDTYAYDIISDLNHGVQGYVEWCMILSHKGQPNPYDNFNSAPVLINPITDEVIYTPLYYLLSHFSKFIRPGARRVGLDSSNHEGCIFTAAANEDGSIVLIGFNSTTEIYELTINLDSEIYCVRIEPRALQTITFRKI